jgi:RNA 3'-terminal phosphate cyclase
LLLFHFTGVEQQFNLSGQTDVPFAPGVDQFRSRLFRDRKGLVKDGLNAQKAVCLGIHID